MKYFSRARHDILLRAAVSAFSNLFSNTISNICPPSVPFYSSLCSQRDTYSTFPLSCSFFFLSFSGINDTQSTLCLSPAYSRLSRNKISRLHAFVQNLFLKKSAQLIAEIHRDRLSCGNFLAFFTLIHKCRTYSSGINNPISTALLLPYRTIDHSTRIIKRTRLAFVYTLVH